LLGFSGFLRYSELANIEMNNIAFFHTHVKIYIEKSKTDIYRRGNSVVIASTNTVFCPVVWLKRYFDFANLQFNSDSYIFRVPSFFKSKSTYELCKVNVPLSYARAMEILLDCWRLVWINLSLAFTV
jgi:hypothetical protein